MDIQLAAIGKCKPGPERALFEHYAARLPWKITLKEYEIKKPLTPEARMREEAEMLLAGCKEAGHLIAMDERGVPMASQAFAAHLRKVRDDGTRRLAFVIGGADGLDSRVVTKAHLTFSFGRVTWPHMLMRGLLAEQLYRAHTILSGHPYHRE